MKSNGFSINVQSIYDWYRQIIRNPKYRWWVILGSLAYILSPIDFLPDIIPIVGQLDDVVLFTLLVSEVSQLLIERVKSNKSVNSTSTDDTNTTASNPVDVNAVQVDEL